MKASMIWGGGHGAGGRGEGEDCSISQSSAFGENSRVALVRPKVFNIERGLSYLQQGLQLRHGKVEWAPR